VVCVGAVEELRARTPAKHALVGEHAAIVAPQHTDALTGPSAWAMPSPTSPMPALSKRA